MKKKLLIAAGVFFALIIIAVIALSFAVKHYLKSEELKALIIPKAEEFTGRQVSIDRIDVSLFKGIVVKKLDVKEEGREFVSMDEFVLDYDLLPLLRKELVISKIALISPRIHIKRFKDGSFNFSDMMEKPEEAEAKAPAEESGGLPVSLVTDRVILKDAQLEFIDEMKEIPDLSVETDADFRVSLKDKISAEGYLDMKKLDATLQGISTSTKGRVDIKRKSVKADITSTVDGKPIDLKATVEDYSGSPTIEFELKADELDVDKLMALTGGGKQGEKTAPSEATQKSSEKSAPLKVTASGTADVKTAKYGEYKLTDLSLDASTSLEITSDENSTTGTVDLRKLKATMNGLSLNTSGNVQLGHETVKVSLNAVADVPEAFQQSGYILEKTHADVSPKLTYHLKREDLSGSIGIKDLTAESIKGQDLLITGLALSGDADVAYNMPSKKMKVSADVRSLKANYEGIDVGAAGKVSYDGVTATADLKNASVKTAEYKSGEHTIRDLDLLTDADLKIDLEKKEPKGTADIKALRANVDGIDISAAGKVAYDGVTAKVTLKGARVATAEYISGEHTIRNLDLQADTDLTIPLKTKQPSGSVDIKTLRANIDGIDLNAAGSLNSDGKIARAAFRELSARSDRYTYETYDLTGLSLSAVTDMKVDIEEKMPAGGTVELKELKANVNGVNTSATGKVTADSRKLTTNLTVNIEQDSIKLTSTANNYRTAPDVQFDVYSKQLNINKLMSITGDEKKEGKTAPQKKPAGEKKEKPKKLTARGKVKIDQANYQEYRIEGLDITLKYINDVLTIDPVKMSLKGGTSTVIDGAFLGNVSFKYPRGDANADRIMKQTMTGKGASTFTKIQVKDSKLFKAIARATSLEELATPTFTKSEFNYVIKDEKINLDGFMNSERIRVWPAGYVGLDKSIDMEINVNLDPVAARRLIITQINREDDGTSTVPLLVTGTTENPKVTVNAKKVLKKEVDRGLKNLFDKLAPKQEEQQQPQQQQQQQQQPQQQQPAAPQEEEQPEEPVKKLFKGLFGK